MRKNKLFIISFLIILIILFGFVSIVGCAVAKEIKKEEKETEESVKETEMKTSAGKNM